MKNITRAFFVLALVFSTVSAMAQTFSIYHIGNSLSQDMYYAFQHVGPRYMETQGGTYTWGYHFRNASSLTYIHLHPREQGTRTTSAIDIPNTPRTGENPQPWPKALRENHWDVVTMQPHPGGNDLGPATLATDTKAVNDMIKATLANPKNKNTRFFIYQAWSDVSDQDPLRFANAYTATTVDPKNPEKTNTSCARDYTAALCDNVRKTYPHVGVIPVGEVLYALDEKMRAGEFQQFKSLSQLHRDVIHLNSAGQNVAAWTAFATIFQKSPVGQPVDELGNGINPPYENITQINDHDLKLMQETIWDVVQKQKAYTNVP